MNAQRFLYVIDGISTWTGKAAAWLIIALMSLVCVEVYVGERMLIASQKLAQPQRIRRVARAHQNDAALPSTDQFQPAQNENPARLLAQAIERLHHFAQLDLCL